MSVLLALRSLAVCIAVCAALAAQTSTRVNSATLNGTNVDVNVDVSFPAGTTATLQFRLIRGGVVVGETEAVPNPGGAGQVFGGIIFHKPGTSDYCPAAAGDKLEADVVCSNGDTATSSKIIP